MSLAAPSIAMTLAAPPGRTAERRVSCSGRGGVISALDLIGNTFASPRCRGGRRLQVIVIITP